MNIKDITWNLCTPDGMGVEAKKRLLRGLIEELERTQAHLNYLLLTRIEGEDGTFTFPDGVSLPCKTAEKPKFNLF